MNRSKNILIYMNVVFRFGATGMQFLLTAFLLIYFDKQTLGSYFSSLSYIMFLGWLFSFGTPMMILKMVSKELGVKREIRTFISVLLLVFSAVLTADALGVIDYKQLVILVCGAIYGLLRVGTDAIRGLNKHKVAMLFEFYLPPIASCLFLICISDPVTSILYSYLLSTFLCVFYILIIRNEVGIFKSSSGHKTKENRLPVYFLGTGLPFVVAAYPFVYLEVHSITNLTGDIALIQKFLSVFGTACGVLNSMFAQKLSLASNLKESLHELKVSRGIYFKVNLLIAISIFLCAFVIFEAYGENLIFEYFIVLCVCLVIRCSQGAFGASEIFSQLYFSRLVDVILSVFVMLSAGLFLIVGANVVFLLISWSLLFLIKPGVSYLMIDNYSEHKGYG